MKFILTQEDVDAANEYEANHPTCVFKCSTCPVAQCIRRTTYKFAIVNHVLTEIEIEDNQFKVYFTPKVIADFINAYDKREILPLLPLEFELIAR